MTASFPFLDQTSFQTAAAAPGVTVIDFTAGWCPPCRVLGAVLGALATEYAGRARFVAVDVDQQPGLAEQLGVRSMPTLVLWRDGREVGRMIGSRPRAFVAGLIDRALRGEQAITAP